MLDDLQVGAVCLRSPAQRGFLDLKRLALEWRYFFFQFELHRVQEATSGRFLLAICLGQSVRALLVVPGELVRLRVGEPLAAEIANLKLIATQLRKVEGVEGASAA
ncbi:MAG TPA: hypothetical protein VN493_05785 [Thermoanaerobaculia bacterium]|nr:hypothetical protein [Thermoanaerobaculia bacterium]